MSYQDFSLPVTMIPAAVKNGPPPRPRRALDGNAALRRAVNETAREVARFLKIPAPVCKRITRKRGHGTVGWFTVPRWALEAHPAYRLYYIAHEVCHGVPGATQHGPAFHLNEVRVLEHYGYRLVMPERGPYPIGIRDLSGAPVCGKWGSRISTDKDT